MQYRSQIVPALCHMDQRVKVQVKYIFGLFFGSSYSILSYSIIALMFKFDFNYLFVIKTGRNVIIDS